MRCLWRGCLVTVCLDFLSSTPPLSLTNPTQWRAEGGGRLHRASKAEEHPKSEIAKIKILKLDYFFYCMVTETCCINKFFKTRFLATLVFTYSNASNFCICQFCVFHWYCNFHRQLVTFLHSNFCIIQFCVFHLLQFLQTIGYFFA